MSTDLCWARHPTQEGIFCQAPVDEQDHSMHYAWPEYQWLNDEYVAPPEPLTRQGKIRQSLDMARQVAAEERVGPVSVDVLVDATKLLHNAPDTSRQAAVHAFPRSGTQRYRILEFVAESPRGRTNDEVHVILEVPYGSTNPRMRELKEGGWIIDSGERRDTRTGNEAVVWVASDKALERLGRKKPSSHPV